MGMKAPRELSASEKRLLMVSSDSSLSLAARASNKQSIPTEKELCEKEVTVQGADPRMEIDTKTDFCHLHPSAFNLWASAEGLSHFWRFILGKWFVHISAAWLYLAENALSPRFVRTSLIRVGVETPKRKVERVHSCYLCDMVRGSGFICRGISPRSSASSWRPQSMLSCVCVSLCAAVCLCVYVHVHTHPQCTHTIY